MGGHKAKTGGHWVADEMQVDVGGQKMWLWNVMDSENPLHPGLPPNPQAGRQRSSCRPEKSGLGRRTSRPRTITSDKLRSYIQPVKDVLPEASHIQSEGIRANINNNLSERAARDVQGPNQNAPGSG